MFLPLYTLCFYLIFFIMLRIFVLLSFFISSYVSFFFFKQKTAYEMRISDWSSDVCSSDLIGPCSIDYGIQLLMNPRLAARAIDALHRGWPVTVSAGAKGYALLAIETASDSALAGFDGQQQADVLISARSEEHTSELQSLMRTSYAVFVLKKKITRIT